MRTTFWIGLFAGLLTGQVTLCPAADSLDVWHLRSTNSLNTVRFVGGIFVGVGDQGRIATSPDGATWMFQTANPAVSLHGVTFSTNYGQPRFVAVGDAGVVLTSSNASSWWFIGGAQDDLSDVAWDSSSRMFVATAHNAYLAAPRVYYSSTAEVWYSTDLPLPPYLYSSEMKRVFALPGVFLAAGAGGFTDSIWRSTNAWDWEYVKFVDGYAGNFVQGNGLLAFINNEACGPLLSYDGGVSWTSVLDTNVCPGGCYHCYMGWDVCFGNGTFATVGYNHVAPLSQMKAPLTSTNLTQWSPRSALQGKNLVTITYGKGTFVAAGPAGIYQSEPVARPGLAASPHADTGCIDLVLSGEIGHSYRLQASPDISPNSANWLDLLSYTNTAPAISYTDWSATNHAVRFYRIISP